MAKTKNDILARCFARSICLLYPVVFSFQVKIKNIIFEVSPPRYYSLSTPWVSHGFTPQNSLPKSPE